MQKIKRTKFNVCLLGEGKVGKTCILSVYNGNPFDENTLVTIGLDHYIDTVKFDGVDYKIKIFDTAGQERYRSISTNTIQLSDGFIIVYAVNDKKSFKTIDYWINVIDEKCDIKSKILMLVGNKIDVENREVSNEEGVNYAKSKNMKYFETSAKTGFGIKTLFKEMYQAVYNKYKELDKNSNNKNNNEKPNIQLDKENVSNKKNKKDGCC